MNRYYCDLHVHSCLSPCGDDDSTPANIAGMATLCGLNIVALTDHNTAKNCPAFFAAAKKYGIIPIAGMELTTSEDIHVVCLFENLEDAMVFDEYLQKRRFLIENRPEIFGTQLIMDETDKVLGSQDILLTAASGISIGNVEKLIDGYGGVCYPAHIDRSSYSVISNLGMITEEMGFEVAEVSPTGNVDDLIEKHPILSRMKILTSSDAHRLDALPPATLSLHTDNNIKSIIRHLKNR